MIRTCSIVVLIFSLYLGNMVQSPLIQKVRADMNIPEKSTWLWNTQTIINDSEAILNFLEDQNVKKLHLQINQDIELYEYSKFIERATEKNIKVYALDGAPNWATKKGKIDQRKFLLWVSNYQKNTPNTQQFSGIHLDIEPYLTPGWNTSYEKTVLAYQTRIIEAKNQTNKLRIPLEADMPFWFDEMPYHNKLGKGSLSEWMIDQVDQITIMAYRDQAEGPNGIIELIKNEMKYAKNKGKTLSIGVETGESAEANYVSFYEEGHEYMIEQLEKVHASYAEYSSLGGFSIHYLHSWMQMK